MTDPPFSLTVDLQYRTDRTRSPRAPCPVPASSFGRQTPRRAAKGGGPSGPSCRLSVAVTRGRRPVVTDEEGSRTLTVAPGLECYRRPSLRSPRPLLAATSQVLDRDETRRGVPGPVTSGRNVPGHFQYRRRPLPTRLEGRFASQPVGSSNGPRPTTTRRMWGRGVAVGGGRRDAEVSSGKCYQT